MHHKAAWHPANPAKLCAGGDKVLKRKDVFNVYCSSISVTLW
jgi:hypothetical protein